MLSIAGLDLWVCVFKVKAHPKEWSDKSMVRNFGSSKRGTHKCEINGRVCRKKIRVEDHANIPTKEKLWLACRLCLISLSQCFVSFSFVSFWFPSVFSFGPHEICFAIFLFFLIKELRIFFFIEYLMDTDWWVRS